MFAPCEKIIRDEHDNISLISLLNTIRVELPLEEIPENAALPIRWDVITVWWKQPEDDGKQFEQHFELIGPDGSVLLTNTAPFAIPGRTHRHIIQTFGFPLRRAAGQDYLLRLYLREDREGAERKDVGAYPLLVEVATRSPKINE